MTEPILKLRSIRKRFGNVDALDGADLELRRGEVMALVGQNGAGKSSLVKVIAGQVFADSGSVEFEGVAKGRTLVAVVQQELSLVGTLSVAENVLLGGSFRGPWLPSRIRTRAAPSLARVGLSHIEPSAPVSTVSLAERQLIEMARALDRDAQVVVLDEPTATLSDPEINRVLDVIRGLRSEGRAVVLVTHRLREVFEVADQVTIVRDGKTVLVKAVAETSTDEVISAMLGRTVDAMFPPRPPLTDGPPVLSVRGLRTPGTTGPLDFDVRPGQVIGLAGQIGSGVDSVLRCIAGVESRTAGTISLDGSEVHLRSLREAVSVGIAYSSSDRRRDGLFLGRPVAESLTAPSLPRLARHGLFKRRAAQVEARKIAERFKVDVARMNSLGAHLSGGNQQKVSVGKWLGISPRLLLIDEPTRGVDVGARGEIYRRLRALGTDGVGTLFASTDTQELLGLSDTIITFYRGRPIRHLDPRSATEEDVIADITHPAHGGTR